MRKKIKQSKSNSGRDQPLINCFLKGKDNSNTTSNKVKAMLKVPMSSGMDPKTEYSFDKFVIEDGLRFILGTLSSGITNTKFPLNACSTTL